MVFVTIGFAQPPQPTNSINRKAEAVKKSLATDAPLQLAKQYEALAKQLIENNKTDKAIENYQKAIAIYEKENKPELKAAVLRQIAQLQESQNEEAKAIKTYELSNQFSNSTEVQSLNFNDVNRLQNSQNPSVQKEMLDSNIQILEKSAKNEEEVANLYVQKVMLETQGNPTVSNLEVLEKTKEKVSANPTQAAKVAQVLAASYEKNKDLEKAISLQKEAVKNAMVSQNQSQIFIQNNKLAVLFAKNQEVKKADSLWRKLYYESLENASTLSAK